MGITHMFASERVREAEARTTQQLHVRIACEQELIEWRQHQIERLQEEVERAQERLYAACAVLYVRGEEV